MRKILFSKTVKAGSMSYGVGRARGKALTGLSFLLIAVFFTFGAARAETVKILALGDSLTAGYGLPAGQGLVPRLQAWLDAAGAEVELVNAGVSGDTTAGGLARLDWSLDPGIGAVIVELGANDVLRGLPPEAARDNLAKIVETVQGRGMKVLLVGMPVPGNYGAEYQRAFQEVWPGLADTHGTQLYPDFFAALEAAPAEALEFMQADGIHPNEKGLAKIVPALGPEVVKLAERVRAGE